MRVAQKIDFPLYCEAAAVKLWGAPTQTTDRELRWGTHGSKSLDRRSGRWFDHEANEGGSTVELLGRELGLGFSEAAAWLRREGLLNGPAPHVDGKPSALGKIAAVYGYTDEAGTLLYEVVRFAPKTFRQRQPDGHGGWNWSVKGCRPVLYCLPEVIAAVPAGQTIHIVEGEKDCENLRAIGLVATCNPGGVGKWRDQYNESLRGADVVIIGDNDDAGRAHAEQVAAALRGVARRVRVLDLAKVWPGCPAKGDISNWIAAGGTAEKLAGLVGRLDAEPAASEAPSGAWPVMDAAAYYGLAGDVVRTIEPHSEADSVALLLQFLTLAGNVIGRTPYFPVESDRHHANLFGVLVGESAKARKGTSMGRVRAVVKVADETWSDDRIKSGLSSGEGLINEVRDERMEWNKKEGREEVADPGAADKRLMIVEPELAGALSAMERHGNMLSPVIRRAWDGDTLSTMTKTSPLKATGAHISVIGHITVEELRARLTRTDTANGFANRFLFALIRRSKELPFGGVLGDSEVLYLGEQLKEVVDKAQAVGRVVMTDAARARWAEVYSALSASQPGLLGAVTARAEAQAVRLALIYALLDGKGEIDEPHLGAALAVWEYCEASAAHIFGDSLGDPVADEILRALHQAGAAGMTRTAIRDLFGHNKTGDRIGAALQILTTRGRTRMEMRGTGGRPAETWFASAEARRG